MKKFSGTVARSNVEGGAWVLKADDGKTYQISGCESDLEDGASVSIDGAVDRKVMGIAMAGPVLRAQSVKRK